MPMSDFRIAWALEKAICEAVGIDPQQTTRVVIDVEAGRQPRLRITQWLTAEQGDALIRVFEPAKFDEVDT